MEAKQEKSSELFDLAQAIAPHISGAWRFHRIKSTDRSSDWRSIAIISDDTQPGRHLHISPCWRQAGRLQICGTMPGSTSIFQKSITVARTRSGRAIGGDINRRLLPEYLQAWVQRSEDNAQRVREAESHQFKQHLMAQSLPGFQDHRQNGSDTQYRSYFCDDERGLRGHVDSYVHYEPAKVRLELHLTFDQLIQLSDALRRL